MNLAFVKFYPIPIVTSTTKNIRPPHKKKSSSPPLQERKKRHGEMRKNFTRGKKIGQSNYGGA
jgi:hypothetical protein